MEGRSVVHPVDPRPTDMAEEQPPKPTLSVNYHARPQFRAFHARKLQGLRIIARELTRLKVPVR